MPVGVPTFTKAGSPVRSAMVGDVISFDVPGYSEVWLYQLQSGREQFNGPFRVPMPNYQLLPRDVGIFQNSVFEVTPQRTRGAMLGTGMLEVVPLPQTNTSATVSGPTCTTGGCPQPNTGTTFTPAGGKVGPDATTKAPDTPLGPGVGGGAGSGSGETAGQLGDAVESWLHDWISHMPESTQDTLRQLPAVLQGPLGILLIVCLVLWALMHRKRGS